MKTFFLLLIKGYQYLLSPLLGNNCRFYPSCSDYLREAMERYGLVKGGYLSLLRIVKCHPYHEGGYDPVPKQETQTEKI